MNSVNQKIIDLIISKAEIVCSDFLVLIGIYGSVVSVDLYEKIRLGFAHIDSRWKRMKTRNWGFLVDCGMVDDKYCIN